MNKSQHSQEPITSGKKGLNETSILTSSKSREQESQHRSDELKDEIAKHDRGECNCKSKFLCLTKTHILQSELKGLTEEKARWIKKIGNCKCYCELCAFNQPRSILHDKLIRVKELLGDAA